MSSRVVIGLGVLGLYLRDSRWTAGPGTIIDRRLVASSRITHQCFFCLISHHWSSVISDAHQINPSTSDLRSRNCARQVGLERRSGYREVLSSRYRCRWLSLRFVQCKEMRSTVRCPNTSGLVSSQWIHLEARHISFDRTWTFSRL